MEKIAIQNIFKTVLLLTLIFSLALISACSSAKESENDVNRQTAEDPQTDQDTGEDDGSDGLQAFHTKDIFGNDVNQDIFLNHKLTLVNVWGTFCGPCLDEMPYLGELQKEYEPKGINIVGIVIDAQDESMEVLDDQVELAKEIVKSTKADYTHMLISSEMIDPVLSKFDAIPASFFVDSEGNIVSKFYIGSRSKDEWSDLIEENLNALQQKP